MYCARCGSMMSDDGRFCPHCGADQYAIWNQPAGQAVQPPPPPRQSARPAQASRPAARPKKKRYILLKLLVLCVVAFGVWNNLRSKIALPMNKAYKPIVSQYSYNALPDDVTRSLYKQISKAAYSYPQEYDEIYFFDHIPIKDGMTDTKFYLAFRAFLDDHPDVFWLYWGTSQMEPGEDVSYVPDHYVVCSLYSYKELKALKAELYDAVERFMDSVPAGLSDGELQRYTHDYLIDHCEYDYDALDENGDCDPDYPNYDRVGEANGALVDGKAICAGYATAYQLMLNRLGVECVPVYGQGNPLDEELQRRAGRTNHQWDAVLDGGAWVMTDPTWDDVDDPARRYLYFNIPIQQMYQDHNALAIDFDTFQYLNAFIQPNTQSDCVFLPQ